MSAACATDATLLVALPAPAPARGAALSATRGTAARGEQIALRADLAANATSSGTCHGAPGG